VVFLREPGGTKISEKIREILLDRKNDQMSPACEMLLYLAARAQVVEKVIKPALAGGKIVLSDRFLDSTLAYQGYGLGVDLRLIKQIGSFATQGIVPDLTLFLDMPLKKAFRCKLKSKDRIEARNLAYHARVRQGYFKLAASQPRRIKVIKVEPIKSLTQRKIREVVVNFLSHGF
jgi:dTMP kinase